MSPFVPNIRQCFNCGQLSHSTKFCTNAAICLVCGLNKHSEINQCSNVMCCVNCKGVHRSLFKDCPEIILKKRTTELMVMQNMDESPEE
ncbi:unnamed protein product [Lasius platythorax]|uniref:CCHC-type domain-containing protein n=1 Tax=Lasius platythorax TaxID=488582 RepID=A0AAV2NN82_9HYME